MNNPRVTQVLPVERVERLIHLARGEKVLLDADLATLYGVTTGNLNKAVKRNQNRFPPDFMFQLTDQEAKVLLFQSGRSKLRGGRRHNPYAFTEQGVAMLSSVLRSERAVQVNVAIMRAFVSLRRMLAGNHALTAKLANWNADSKATTKPSNPFSAPFVNSWHRLPNHAAKSAFTPSAGKRLTKVKPNPNANEIRRTGKTLLAQFPFQGSEEPVQETGAVNDR